MHISFDSYHIPRPSKARRIVALLVTMPVWLPLLPIFLLGKLLQAGSDGCDWVERKASPAFWWLNDKVMLRDKK